MLFAPPFESCANWPGWKQQKPNLTISTKRIGLVVIINNRKSKKTDCRLVLWQLYLVILVYISILSFKSLQGLPYLFATTLVTIFAFAVFTRSIQERFIWLIVLMPLGHPFFKQVSGIYITPFDIACLLLCAEIILKQEYLSFPRRKEVFLAIFIVFSILITSLLSPLGGMLEGRHLGIIVRTFTMIFLFFISLKIFNNQNHLLQIFRAISSMIVTFTLIYLLMFLNNLPVGVFLMDTNAIGLMVLSASCLFISQYARRKSIFLLIMCFFLVLAFMTPVRTNLIIFTVDALFLIMFLLKKSRAWKALLIVILLGIIAIPTVRVFDDTVNSMMNKVRKQDAQSLRVLALVSNAEAFLKYPVFGLGYGNSIKRGALINVDDSISFSRDDGSNVYLSTHNTFLRVGVDSGLCGLIPFCLLFYYYFYELFIRKRYKTPGKFKTLHAINKVDLIDAIVKVLFINILLFCLTWDIFSAPKLWMLFAVFSLWIKVKIGYEKTVEPSRMWLVGSQTVRQAGNA